MSRVELNEQGQLQETQASKLDTYTLSSWYRDYLNKHLDDPNTLTDWRYQLYYTMIREDMFVLIGELSTMPDHYIFAGNRTGKMYIGFHLDDFDKEKRDV